MLRLFIKASDTAVGAHLPLLTCVLLAELWQYYIT